MRFDYDLLNALPHLPGRGLSGSVISTADVEYITLLGYRRSHQSFLPPYFSPVQQPPLSIFIHLSLCRWNLPVVCWLAGSCSGKLEPRALQQDAR